MNGMLSNLKKIDCIEKLVLKRKKMAGNLHEDVEIVDGAATTSHKSSNSVLNFCCTRIYVLNLWGSLFFLQFRNSNIMLLVITQKYLFVTVDLGVLRS